MRGWILAIMLALVPACVDPGDADGDIPLPPDAGWTKPAEAPKRPTKPPIAPIPNKQPAITDRGWKLAILSDLHLPNYRKTTVERTVAALIALKVRAVIITGDHTNGSAIDGPARIASYPMWWATIKDLFRPLRDAGIAVLPVAGNHDAYLVQQRDAYARAFADLERWAKPFTINKPTGTDRVAMPPFTYSVEIGDVHLSLIHIVKTRLEPSVAAWLDADLAAAHSAKHRMVFAHVPLSSVLWSPNKLFVGHYGGILERGKVGFVGAGHEHLVWDEDVALPGGGKLRQLIVGCASGYYEFGPSDPAKLRAKCKPVKQEGKREPMRCRMPNGGEFRLARGRKNRHLQHYSNAFVVVTIDGDKVLPRPMSVDANGALIPYYLDE